RTSEPHPLASCASDLWRVWQWVIHRDRSLAGYLEVRLGLPVCTGEYDVHHSRSRPASKKSFDCWRHDFCFRLARLIRVHQRPKTFHDDVHCVADFDEFFFTLNRPRRNGHRSEEHTSELQSRRDLVCRLLLEKKKIIYL